MMTDQQIWRNWARTLHRWGVSDWVASILEVAGPLTAVGAQAVYIGQPMFRTAFSQDQLEALARVLEDSTQTKAFARYLREEHST